MMTRSEARQRAALNNCSIVWNGEYQEYRVYHNAWTRKQREERTYFTDDLEDAVLTTGKMTP